jgi:archaellum component FlaG (FlaF/FlaG flagellin family)
MSGSRLYAQGGDLNGGSIVGYEPTDLIESLELSSWPGGAWSDLGDPLPLDNIYPAGACTEARAGGEIWGVGGGLNISTTIYSTNLYHSAEPCLGYNYALALVPDAQSGEGYRSGTVDYTLTVTNTGDTPDAYTLAVTGTWTTTVSGLGGALDPDQGRAFTVTVEVPAGAALGESDLTTLTLTSQGDPIQQASAAITTTAAPRYEVVLSPGAAELVEYQGALVIYTLQLTNTGDVTDTFTLAAGEAGWTVTLPLTETTLAPGEGIAVNVLVAIPADAPDGGMDTVIITATSQGDPLAFASSTLTTAVWRRTYLPLITSN